MEIDQLTDADRTVMAVDPSEVDVLYCARVAYAAYRECFEAGANAGVKPEWDGSSTAWKQARANITREAIQGKGVADTNFGILFVRTARLTYRMLHTVVQTEGDLPRPELCGTSD